MSLPDEVVKPIEEIKNPILRILVVILILGIMFTSVYAIKESGTSKSDLKDENDRLRANEIVFRRTIEDKEKVIVGKDSVISAQSLYIISGVEEDKKRLVKRTASFDSILAALQYANERLREKK